MEKNGGSLRNVIIAMTSFCSSIIAIFTMYYVFATIALITGIIGLKNEDSKPMSITSLIIVAITLITKLLGIVTATGSLPAWLTNGLF